MNENIAEKNKSNRNETNTHIYQMREIKLTKKRMSSATDAEKRPSEIFHSHFFSKVMPMCISPCCAICFFLHASL